jgi:RNA-directed DNA polymerase
VKRREAQAKDLTLSKQKLAKRQKGRCLQCFESLFNGEDIQIHRRLSTSQGGKDLYSNLALVHALCHQQIHIETDRALGDCRQYNDQQLSAEERKRA